MHQAIGPRLAVDRTTQPFQGLVVPDLVATVVVRVPNPADALDVLQHS